MTDFSWDYFGKDSVEKQEEWGGREGETFDEGCMARFAPAMPQLALSMWVAFYRLQDSRHPY